jgi:hypothetical protein
MTGILMLSGEKDRQISIDLSMRALILNGKLDPAPSGQVLLTYFQYLLRIVPLFFELGIGD